MQLGARVESGLQGDNQVNVLRHLLASDVAPINDYSGDDAGFAALCDEDPQPLREADAPVRAPEPPEHLVYLIHRTDVDAFRENVVNQLRDHGNLTQRPYVRYRRARSYVKASRTRVARIALTRPSPRRRRECREATCL